MLGNSRCSCTSSLRCGNAHCDVEYPLFLPHYRFSPTSNAAELFRRSTPEDRHRRFKRQTARKRWIQCPAPIHTFGSLLNTHQMQYRRVWQSSTSSSPILAPRYLVASNLSCAWDSAQLHNAILREVRCYVQLKVFSNPFTSS